MKEKWIYIYGKTETGHEIKRKNLFRKNHKKGYPREFMKGCRKTIRNSKKLKVENWNSYRQFENLINSLRI